MKSHALSDKLRSPSAGKPEVKEHELVCIETSYPEKMPDGRDTFAGVYRKLFPEFQKERRIKEATAKGYHSAMSTHVLGLFEGTAFEDLYEEDFIDAWNKLLAKRKISKSALKSASIVIRGLMQMAYDRHLTQTTLWGLPQFNLDDDTDGRDPHDSDDIKNEGKCLAHLGVWIRKSLSLSTEIKVMQNLLDGCEEHGEMYAAIAMFLTGARTSEATALSWKHFKEYRAGYWELIRYDVSEKDSREVTMGGKTNNAFRYLPLPDFFSRLLLERREFLLTKYTEDALQELPIACRGTQYEVRCTQRELNRCMKNVYQNSGVEEEVFFDAYKEIRDDASLAADCEGKATAYLARHQFATALAYSGASMGDIYTLMGHKEEDENVKKSDYANPDQLASLADKLNRRPIVRIFNQNMAPADNAHTYICDGSFMNILDDGDVEIRPSKGQTIKVTLAGAECGDPVLVETQGMDVRINEAFSLPRNVVPDTLSIKNQLYAYGDEVLDAVKKEEVQKLRPCEAAVEAELHPDDSCIVAVTAAPVARPLMIRPEEPESTAIPADDPAEYGIGREAAPVAFPAADESARSEEPQEETVPTSAESAKEQPAVLICGLFQADGAGGIARIPESVDISRRARVGKKLLPFGKGQIPGRLLLQNREEAALVLSPSGRLFRIAKGQPLDELQETNPARTALADGGILLQGLQEDGGSIVCLADTGRIRRVSLQKLHRIPREGRQLVTPDENERIVSACLCAEDSDVLLFTCQGKALRIAHEQLRSVRCLGAGLISGVETRDADRGAVCIPYRPGEEYLIISKFGKAVRLACNFKISPHSRGSQGIFVKKAERDDEVLAVFPAQPYILLASSSGRSLCIRTDDIPTVKGPAGGVETMKLHAGQHLISAVGVAGGVHPAFEEADL